MKTRSAYVRLGALRGTLSPTIYPNIVFTLGTSGDNSGQVSSHRVVVELDWGKAGKNVNLYIT